MENELKKLVDSKEKILYEGRPSKKCFIFESIFNPLLPIAIIWGLIDAFFIYSAFGGMGESQSGFSWFLIPFFNKQKQVLGETASSKTGAKNVQDEHGSYCNVRKQRKCLKNPTMMGACQRNVGTNVYIVSSQ